MRNDLPKTGPREYEAAVINLDDKNGSGTHWVAYRKVKEKVVYFDSFGNLKPPKELIDYFGVGSTILYNYDKYQDFNTIVCGHLCLQFLSNKMIIDL